MKEVVCSSVSAELHTTFYPCFDLEPPVPSETSKPPEQQQEA